MEPNSHLAERYHVCGAFQLASFSKTETFPFQILNRTHKPVTTYCRSTIGTFTPSAASMSVSATADSPTQPLHLWRMRRLCL